MFSFKVPFYVLHTVFLLWIFCVYLSGIWVFSTGFLLSRIEFNNHSECHSTEDLEKLGLSSCQATPPSFSRAVILLIDGLRYDFALYDNNAGSKTPNYRNKMPIFKRLLEKAPHDRSLLVPFLADPPTTTLQRLKGLTTGSLPTFVDVGANFASDEIAEDNIITQCVRHRKRIVFMGDDTWTGLFPRRFHRSFPYPSFNVKVRRFEL